MVRLNNKTKTIIDFSGLTIQDMIRLERAMGVVHTKELETCKTKKEFVEAFSRLIPEVKSFHRLSLPSLRELSEVFYG